MSNCCFDVSCDDLLSFNCLKLAFETISWCNSFKYLKLHFTTGTNLQVDFDSMKRTLLLLVTVSCVTHEV